MGMEQRVTAIERSRAQRQAGDGGGDGDVDRLIRLLTDEGDEVGNQLRLALLLRTWALLDLANGDTAPDLEPMVRAAEAEIAECLRSWPESWVAIDEERLLEIGFCDREEAAAAEAWADENLPPPPWVADFAPRAACYGRLTAARIPHAWLEGHFEIRDEAGELLGGGPTFSRAWTEASFAVDQRRRHAAAG